jgi:hypothetical protein
MFFSFSITPKRFLHDAIAAHRDNISISAPENTLQVSHTVFSCKADNLVAESPFTEPGKSCFFSPFPFFADEQGSIRYHFFSSAVFFFEHRGPPDGA